MENFYYDDNFCMDFDDLLFHLDLEEEDLKDLPEDFSVTVCPTRLEKICQLTKDDLVNQLVETVLDDNDDRIGVDSCEKTENSIKKAIEAGIDIDKINAALPELYYPIEDSDEVVTKQDLINHYA